jgi:hypothetical protein
VAGETVISSATRDVLSVPVPLTALPAQLVKGRETPVTPYKVGPPGTPLDRCQAAEVREDPAIKHTVTEQPKPFILHDNAAPLNQMQGTRTWKLWKALRRNSRH